MIFSWIEFPDKATRDSVHEEMRTNPPEDQPEMPFDGKRMFFGGFEQVVNE